MRRARSARSHSLVIRLLIAQVVPLAIFAVVVLAVGAWTAQRVVAANADRLLAGALQTIRETVSVTDDHITVDVAPWALALLDGPERDAVFYSVREGDRLVTGYAELPNLPLAQADRPVFADLSVRGVSVRMAQQTLVIPGRDVPVRVSIAQSLDSRRASLRELYRSMLLLPGLLVVLAALLIWPALQWGLNSLKRLIDDLTRRPSPSSDFAPTNVELAPRELWPVLNAFNHLLARLEISTSGVQRFAADASHQLRTAAFSRVRQSRTSGRLIPAMDAAGTTADRRFARCRQRHDAPCRTTVVHGSRRRRPNLVLRRPRPRRPPRLSSGR